ncbi:MAG: LptE family protein [Alloprevotella sp.]|nr:LPS assembly lipoprotein LptE [Bacteroidales bacterium]MDY3943643.1 LptE family protein [Alloprevotella sp.]
MKQTLLRLLVTLFLSPLLVACKIGYSFTGTSINYNVTKTIQLDKIVNRASYVWAPMETMLNNSIKDRFANQTQLRQVKRDGDIQISGEIMSYDQFNKSISSDGYSSQVQLRMVVNIRYKNRKTNETWEKPFSATTQYSSTVSLASVQERLVTEMINDIVDQIFNASVANW